MRWRRKLRNPIAEAEIENRNDRMLIDTHAHLDFPEFSADLPDVLQRARAAGVERIITIGCDVASSRRAIELAERHDGIYAVVGIHPNAAHEAGAGWLEEIRAMAAHPRVVALGECGLDWHWLPEVGVEVRKTIQREVFAAQLELAAELKRNVVVHQRDCWEDCVAAIRPFSGRVRGVFHCFGGTPAQVDEVLALGHCVSFTGIVTFKNAAQVRAAAQHVPADQFFLETDAPYLSPVPYRGRRCEPTHVRNTADCIATERGVSLGELAAQTTRNAEAFFGLPPANGG